MFNACVQCGTYSEEKTIDPSGPYAICPACGYAHRFRQQPLFVITGASGTGKSTATLDLLSCLPECVILEVDMFWRPEFATPENEYYDFRNLCLRVAKNVGQSGRPAVLSGTALPKQYEGCAERRYFADSHYIALVCDDDDIVRRLGQRKRWQSQPSVPGLIDQMVAFNRWIKDNAAQTSPPLTLLDTSRASPPEVAHAIAGWVRARLPNAEEG
jgi:hypothetical protein